MIIKPISEFIQPPNGPYNQTVEQKAEQGYRVMPEQPPLEAGYTRLSITAIEGDGINGQWQVVDRLTSEIEAEARAADLAANSERYGFQNEYLRMCDQLTGTTAHTKLGFAELQAIITAMQATQPLEAMTLALQLLTLDAALKRVGGLQWWDNCEWKELT